MLTERQRAVLERELGQEVAEILISQHPEDLVSKDFLRAELAEFRAEVADRFRQQTMWLLTVVTAAIAVSTTLASIFG